jgi:hypothetical protein
MSAKEDPPTDTRDALEVLEAEAKEWDKVRLVDVAWDAISKHGS